LGEVWALALAWKTYQVRTQSFEVLSQIISQVIVDMTTQNLPPCTVNGRDMYYKINDIRNVTENKVVKSGFETKFLIDTVKAIRGQCFNVHQQCKGLYPVVEGKEAGRKWLTSIDQDNDISLQQTLDKSDIPILYNTPRFCDPGITKSRNWSLKNYITTRLFMYNDSLKNGQLRSAARNSQNCYDSIVFDFRPFTFSMELPGEYNKTTGRNNKGKKIYITQWIENAPVEDVKTNQGKITGTEYGFKPNTVISDRPYTPNVKSTLEFFKELVRSYSKRGKFGKNNSASTFNSPKPVNIGTTNKDIDSFITFIKKYDGVGFAGANNNSNVVLPVSNSRKGILNLKLEDDIIRMFFFDLIHDLGKSSAKFKDLTYNKFKRLFIVEVELLKKGSVHRVSGFKTGAGTTGKSYEKYESLVQKKTNGDETPAIFKTLGDLTQYIYAAKYNTTVASGDRMGIAVGLYACAKMGFPVKTMIEDGVTGFVLYTGRKQIKFSSGSVCRRGGNNSGVCIRNAKTNISTNNLRVPPAITQQMNAIEARKPKLPPNMKSLMSLWTNSASVINTTGVEEIIKTIKAFDGYWSKDDLKKFLNIVQTLQNRKNIKPTSELSRKLNVLRGEFRGQLPNNGISIRSNANRAVPSGGSPVEKNNRTQRVIRREQVKQMVNNARRKANAAIKTPTAAKPSNPTMKLNNSARRRNNLNRYIKNLNSQFTQVGLPNRLNKNVYMKKLDTSNTDTNLNKIKQNALNNVKLLATKGAFKQLMRKNYPNITTNNKKVLNSLINGAQNKNKLVNNIGPFINKMQGERQAQRQQGQNRGRNN
jgi:hypothetical protein